MKWLDVVDRMGAGPVVLFLVAGSWLGALAGRRASLWLAWRRTKRLRRALLERFPDMTGAQLDHYLPLQEWES